MKLKYFFNLDFPMKKNRLKLSINVSESDSFENIHWDSLIKHDNKTQYNMYYFLYYLNIVTNTNIQSNTITTNWSYVTRFKWMHNIQNIKNNLKKTLLLQFKSIDNSNPLFHKLSIRHQNIFDETHNNYFESRFLKIKEYILKQNNFQFKQILKFYFDIHLKNKSGARQRNNIIEFFKLVQISVPSLQLNPLELKNAFLPLKTTYKKNIPTNKFNQIHLFIKKYVNYLVRFYNNLLMKKHVLKNYNVLLYYNKKFFVLIKNFLQSLGTNKILQQNLFFNQLLYPILYYTQNIVNIQPFTNILYYINKLITSNVKIQMSQYVYYLYLKIFLNNTFRIQKKTLYIFNNINTLHLYKKIYMLIYENQPVTYNLIYKPLQFHAGSFIKNYQFLLNTMYSLNTFFYLSSYQYESFIRKKNYLTRFNIKLILYNYYIMKFKYQTIDLTKSQLTFKFIMCTRYFNQYLSFFKNLNIKYINIYLMTYKLTYLILTLYLKKMNSSFYIISFIYLVLHFKKISQSNVTLNTKKMNSAYPLSTLITTYLNFLTLKVKKQFLNIDTNSLFTMNRMQQLLFFKIINIYKNYILKNKLKFVTYKQYNFYVTQKINKYKNNAILEGSYLLKKKISFLNQFKKSISIKKNIFFKKYAFFKKYQSNLLYILNPLPKVIIRMNKRNCFVTVSNYDNTVIKNFSLVNLALGKKVKLLDMQLNFLLVRYFIGFFTSLKDTNFN